MSSEKYIAIAEADDIVLSKNIDFQ